jgi:hypothetical protein
MLQRACAEVRYKILHVLGISIIVSHNVIVISHKEHSFSHKNLHLPTHPLSAAVLKKNDKRETQYYEDQFPCCTFAYTAVYYSAKCCSVFMTIQLQLEYFQ